MKNDLIGIISKLDTAEDRISEVEDISIVCSKTKKQRLKRTIPKNCGKTTEIIYNMHNGYTRGRREVKTLRRNNKKKYFKQ